MHPQSHPQHQKAVFPTVQIGRKPAIIRKPFKYGLNTNKTTTYRFLSGATG